MTVEIIRRTLQPASHTVDAGAHKGFFLDHVIRAAPAGRHYAFEPIPELAQRLVQRFPTAVVHQVALADTDGETTFRYMPDGAAESSLYERPAREEGRHVVPLTVSVRTLDGMLPAGEQVDFVKIDVEDAEVPLLRGAAATLRRSVPVVVFECHVDRVQAATALLAEAGLAVALMEDFLAGRRRPPEEVFDLAVAQGEFCFAAGPA
jgi:FkbM family methyltransferase